MTIEELEKRLISLEKKERATNKLLNVFVTIVHRNVKLKPDDEAFLKQETLAFHEAHGLNVERLDQWLKEGGSITLAELSKEV